MEQVPMQSEILIIVLMFLFGIFQGLTVCNMTCGPLLILRLAGQARGARDGLRLSFLFTLPRMLILTILGGLMGALGYSTTRLADISSFPFLQAIVYIIIAAIMIATGLRFVGILGSRNKECGGKPTLKDRIMVFLMKIGPRKGIGEGRSLMGVGILISVICFVEASGASLAVASLLGLDSTSIGSGILTGSITMLFYSIGLSIPLLLLGTGASEMGKRFNTEDIRIVGGLLLIVFGVAITIIELYLIFS